MLLLIIIAYLLQTTLFKAISIAGIVPNILMIITSSFGLMRGKNEGMLVGFCAGLIADIFFMDILGFYALVFMTIGYLKHHNMPLSEMAQLYVEELKKYSDKVYKGSKSAK